MEKQKEKKNQESLQVCRVAILFLLSLGDLMCIVNLRELL